MASEAVLVTGGAGYIGSHVCKALSQAGYTPVVLDDLSMGHKWAVKWGPLVEAQIDDVDALRHIVSTHNPVGVIHLAAKAYVGESVQHPDLYMDVNGRQLLALLNELRGSSVAGVVFSSSCSIYGTPDSMPVTEKHRSDPLSPYAQTKQFGEWAIKAYSNAYGFKYGLMRYFNASGADPDGEIGEDHDPETHLIPNALTAALKGTPLSVFGSDYPTPDGTCIRDYVHVTDLADAHVRALNRIREGVNVIANLGSETGNSVLEVARTIEKVSGKTINLDFQPRRAGDAEALYASCAHAKAELGWVPRFQNIEDIVETAYKWTVAHNGG